MNDRISKLKEIGLYGDYTEEELPNDMIDLIYNREAIYSELSNELSSESFSESYDDLYDDYDDDYVYDIITIAFVIAKYWYIFGN